MGIYPGGIWVENQFCKQGKRFSMEYGGPFVEDFLVKVAGSSTDEYHQRYQLPFNRKLPCIAVMVGYSGKHHQFQRDVPKRALLLVQV